MERTGVCYAYDCTQKANERQQRFHEGVAGGRWLYLLYSEYSDDTDAGRRRNSREENRNKRILRMGYHKK